MQTFTEMRYIKLLIILWCTARGQAAACSICVAANMNESRVECQLYNITGPNIRLVADVRYFSRSCKTVNLFFTSGTHTLNNSIEIPDFKRRRTISMVGAANGNPSVIHCIGNNGIRFSQNKKVHILISDLTFTHCKGRALYFKYVSYTLRNVAIVNTNGYGLFAEQCTQHLIMDCRFVNNTEGHITLCMGPQRDAFVDIKKTALYAGKSTSGSGGISVTAPAKNGVTHTCVINIAHCTFDANEGSEGSHMLIMAESNLIVTIEDSTFSNSLGAASTYGVSISSVSLFNTIKNVAIRNCSLFKNGNGAVGIIHAQYVAITNCTITNNRGTGVFIRIYWIRWDARTIANMAIVNTTFSSNIGGVYFYAHLHKHKIKISHCKFTNHILGNTTNTDEAVVQFKGTGDFIARNVYHLIENSVFERNSGNNDNNCSCLSVRSMGNFVLNDVIFTDNKCTGITLIASNMAIQNRLEIERNFGMLGGALQMLSERNKNSTIFSSLILSANSTLIITKNYARFHGGGLYTDQTCENRHTNEDCPFQFEGGTPTTAAMRFTGNLAELGGDVSYGGCLSNCYIHTNSNHHELININNPHDSIYNIVSLAGIKSSSTFAEFPKGVMFCSNTTTPSRNSTRCKAEHTVNAYRGETFELPLMIADEFCVPSVEYVEARITQGEKSAYLGDVNRRESYRKSKKHCGIYYYLIKADLNVSSVKIELFIHQDTLSRYSPATLTVQIHDCPAGFEFDKDKWECVCSSFLKHRGIKCDTGTHTLEIPAFTWIGEIQGREAIHKYCQFCNAKGEVSISSINDSDKLCTRSRTGVLCGKCVSGSSLMLGGYECGDCSRSTYGVALLLVGFAVAGLAMVLLLLSLNLTVSMGTLNGLVFYSNIVYLNRDVLLPLNQGTGRTHLDNAITLLFTFQAWMNLDFGITVCFFDGYSIYISTWLQFVFPLYIWLLIQAIIVASRYSRRVSKVTASNTVSVLATLMLLSYAKLLTTIIEAGSYTDAEFLDDSSRQRVWLLDGSIQYLRGKHLPLFLISLFMAAIYIFPFTLLILLGPLLQAKSHWRLLNWVNKIKPFLDAFYGPYTSRYRYWPGILLSVRLAVFGTVAYYSLGDAHFKMVTISLAVATLLLTWMVIGKTHRVSLHQKRGFNYLELFFHMNLLVFAIFSIYNTQITERTRNQQFLALVMVGSVLAVFCGILVYQMCCVLLRFSAVQAIRAKYRCVLLRFSAVQAIRAKVSTRGRNASNDETSQTCPQEEEHRVTAMTHSSVEMKEYTQPIPSNELREPLLTN